MAWICKVCGTENEDNYIACTKCLNYYNSEQVEDTKTFESINVVYNYDKDSKLSFFEFIYNIIGYTPLLILSSIINIALLISFYYVISLVSLLFSNDSEFFPRPSLYFKIKTIIALIIYLFVLFGWNFVMYKLSKTRMQKLIIPTKITFLILAIKLLILATFIFAFILTGFCTHFEPNSQSHIIIYKSISQFTN